MNLRAGQTVQGGSSITQQVAKLVWFDNTRTLERKIKEIPAALALEWKFSKNEILSIYLNRAYLGSGATGFEAASERYFGKSAAQVDPAEAAMLAGLLRAPSRFAPTGDLARAQARARTIVGLMAEQGYLTAAQAEEARRHPAVLSAAAAARAGGSFADWVMSSGPDFLTRKTTEDVEVLTTFDPRVQRAAEAGLAAVFETKLKAGSNVQAAVVVMSPDGAVRAMIGGRDLGAGEGQFNRATQARRQTGSLFKPFIYAAALQSGASPYDPVLDAPLSLYIPGSGDWTPENYSREYLGQITLAQALAQSINTATVRVSEATGRERVRAVAQDLGVTGPIADGPALALGVSEATLLEMTGAYAGFLNQGLRTTPYGLTELRRKSDGAPLMQGGPRRARARPRREGGGRAGLDDVPGDRPRHRRPRPASRRPPGRRQDRHHPGRPRRLVRGLHRRLRHRRLDGLRRQHPAHRHHRRRPAGGNLARDHGPRRGRPPGPPAPRPGPRAPGRRRLPAAPRPGRRRRDRRPHRGAERAAGPLRPQLTPGRPPRTADPSPPSPAVLYWHANLEIYTTITSRLI